MQRPRTPSKLSESIHQQLNMYALAASAAGVGMLALVPTTEFLLPSGIALAGIFALAEPAEAKIVYTPAHVHIGNNSGFYLDLNHDGINDFEILYTSATKSYWVLHVSAEGSNQMMGRKGYGSASALHAGVRIGPREPFAAENTFMAASVCNPSCRTGGQWANHGKGVKNRYLGLKFMIKGKAHYGWARLNVAFKKPHGFLPILTGYAYETIPNKPIIAGRTKGPGVITVEPASLGHLAAGASAISARRESVDVSH